MRMQEPIDLSTKFSGVKNEWPPNLEKIKFHMGPEFTAAIENFETQVPVFTYYPYIYVPTGHELSPDVRDHESVHLRQQEHYPGGAEAWWERWLTNVQFRFEQELEAYAVQLNAWRKAGSSRFKRTKDRLAMDMSSDFYGHMVTFQEAEYALRRAEKRLYEGIA